MHNVTDTQTGTTSVKGVCLFVWGRHCALRKTDKDRHILCERSLCGELGACAVHRTCTQRFYRPSASKRIDLRKKNFFLVRCTSDRVRCAVFFSSQSFVCLCLSIFKSIRELTPSVGLVWLTSVFFDVWFRFLVTTLVNDQWKALYESRVWSVPCAFLGAK